MWARAMVAGLVVWGSAATAADLGVMALSGGSAAERLEVVRYVTAREGRRVVVPGVAGPLATIEWRRPVEVRMRTVSGASLSPAALAAARTEALACDRGTPVDAGEVVELNGTYVLRFDCAWLQGQ